MARRVIMVYSISGGRADGRMWPNAGESLVLGNQEAFDLIRGGMARPHPDGFEVPDEPMAIEGLNWIEPDGTPASTLAGEVEQPDEQSPADAEGVVPQEPESDEPPMAYEPKTTWVRYAMKKGASLDEVGAMTKAQLQERYGARP